MTTQKKAISIILGGLIIFIWNALSWMVLPFHSDSLINLPENAISMENLSNNLTEDGVYHYPGLPADDSDASMKAIEDKLATGPRITMMVYSSAPSSMFEPGDFFLSFIFNIVVAALLLFIVDGLGRKTPANIFMLCFIAGLLVSFESDMPTMSWYKFPVGYTVANVLDHLIGFGLVGLLFLNYSFKNAQPANEE